MSTFDRKNSLKQALQFSREDVRQASHEKVALLKEYAADLRANEVAESPDANNASWVNLSGLNPRGNGAAALNSLASYVSGAGRLAGHVISAVPNAVALSAEAMLDEEDYAAYNRFQTGNATPADITRLNTPKQRPSFAQAKAGSAAPSSDGPVAMNLFLQAEAARGAARKVVNGLDVSTIVHQDRREKLREDLTSNFAENWGKVTSAFDGGGAESQFMWGKDAEGLVKQGNVPLKQGDKFRAGDLEQLETKDGVVLVSSNGGKAAYEKTGAHHGVFKDSDSSIKYLQNLNLEASQNPGQTIQHAEADRKGDFFGGLGGLLSEASKAVANNKLAAAEYVVENVPQLAVGMLGKAGKAVMLESNAGYAADTYSQGIENYQAKNGGKLPPKDVRNRMQAEAVALAAAEQVGDMVGLAGIGKIGSEAARATLKRSLLNVGKATVGSGATEAATEGYQTALEESIKGGVATGEDIYLGATIGAVSGGAISGSGRTLAEVTKATPEHAADRAKAAAAEKTDKVTFDAAVEAGDHTVFMDRKSPAYDPAKAVGVLMAVSEKPDTAPEKVQENLSTATEIMERLEVQRNQLDPKKVEQDLKDVRAELAQVDPADTDTVTDLTEQELELTEHLASLNDKKNAVGNKNKVTVLDKQLADTRKTYQGLVRLTEPALTKTEVDTNFQTADSTDVEASSKAAETLINLSMVAPDDVDPAGALKLANNTKNGLTQEQRTFLRQFSEARVAENLLKDMGKVSKEVLYGSTSGTKMVGIAQYRTRIAAALASQNKDGATRQLTQLGNFAVDHAAKLEMVQQAFARASNAAAPVNSQIIKQGKEWVVNTGKRLSDKELKDNGGVNIHKNSGTLVGEIAQEATALAAAHTQLASAVALRFDGAAVQSGSTPAAPTEAPDISSISLREMREREGRVEVDKSTSPETVVKSPQKLKKNLLSGEDKQARIDAILAANPNNGGVARTDTAASPSATSPVVASADATATPATASASAVTLKEETQPVATEQPAAAPAEATAAEVATAEEQNSDTILTPSGRLGVLASYVKALPATIHEMFKQKDFNPVAQYLTQTAGNEQSGSQRPLVAIKDFYSSVMNRSVGLEQFLKTAPYDHELVALRHFFSQVKKWNPVLKNNLAEYSQDPAKFEFRFEDMMQFLTTKEGDALTIDENVLTAMSYAGYNWAVNEAGAPRKTPEQLNAMHGRDGEALIDPEAFALLRGVSNIEDTTIADLGGVVVSALGFKARKGAPKDIMPRLQTALGTHVMAMLEQQGVLRREHHNTKDMNALFAPNGVKYDSRDVTTYVYANKENLAAFKEVNKGTKNVVDRLFAAEVVQRIALTEPTKFVQKFAQHTRQEVSKAQAKAINDVQQTPHRIIPEMWTVLTGLGEEGLLRIAGKLDVETDSVHARNIEGVEAQNDNLKNQFDLMLEMLEASVGNVIDFNRAFYVTGEVWKQFRAGFTTQSLNQQTSKIHRYMFGRPSWTVKVDLANRNQVNDLKIAIAAGLGVKTDEQTNDKTLDLLQDMLGTPEVQVALLAMQMGLKSGKWENTDAIVELASGAEGMLSLQALVALAKYENAVEAKDKDVTVTMLVGADGKTNGPILTHLALGAADSVDGLLTMMERGGMYQEGEEQPGHFSAWRQTGKQDLYQDLAAALLVNVKAGIDRVFSQAQYDALQVITGALEDKAGQIKKAGRNLVKTPLTAFAFGSALEGSVEAMEDKFLASVYETIESLARSGEDAAPFIRAVNTLTKMGNPASKPTPETTTAKELLGQELSKQDERALRAAFKMIMEQPVMDTMNTYFATFIQRRSDLNSTIQAGYAMYAAAFASARQKLMDKLMASGEMAYRMQRRGDTSKKIPMHDLSVEQENELRKELSGLLPVAHTAYSLKAGSLEQGLYMAKSEASLSNDALYQSKTTLANAIERGDGSMKNELPAKGMTRTEVNPGVAGTPYFIHSLDSALMHIALNNIPESMNVHDEIGNGVDKISQAAGAINRATYENLLAFSPAREALGMLERIAVSMAAGIKDGTVSKEAVAQTFADWSAIVKRRNKLKYLPTAAQAANSVMGMALENAVQADILRLGTLARLGSVDQYTWEGGQFKVTPSLRAEAQKRLDEMVTDIAPEAKTAMNELVKFLSTKELPAATAVTEQSDAMPSVDTTTQLGVTGAALATVAGESVTPDIINAMEPAARAETIQKITTTAASLGGTGLTAWGQLGQPAVMDVAIRDAFAATPEMNRNQVVALLAKTLTGGSRTILSQVARSLPENLKVVLVTPDTPTDAVLDMPHENSRGWFVATKGGDNVVYVLSDAFVHTGLNAETLLHELVHGALAREIKNPASKASKSLATDLTSLMEHVKAQPGAAKFAAATQDIQEFLAWGLSNREFQKFLNGVQYTASKTTRNRLVTAMKEFIRIISRGLWDQGALAVLIQNAAGLFEQAAANTSTVDINQSHAAPAQDYTTADIYDALGQNAVQPLSAQDDGRLRALMIRMVSVLNPIYGVFGKDGMTKQTLSAQSLFAMSVQPGGIAPFASSSIAAGFGSNEQVAFILEQVEVTVRTAISGDDGQTSAAYRQLAKLHEEARTKLKPSDFGPGAHGQAQYDFLFKVEAGADNRSDYLSRFAALGLVNPQVNALLNFQTDAAAPVQSATTIVGKLQAVFENILEWITGKWTATHAGQKADAKLDALATQLVLIEAKRRARLNVQRSQTIENIEEVFRGVGEKARDKVEEFAKLPVFRNSGNGYVRFASTITSTIAKDRLDQLFLAYQTFSDTHFHNSQGMFSGLITELQGSKDDNRIFYKLLRMAKFLEGQRKDLISNTSKIVSESFVNNGKDLTDDAKKAISAVFLRTDMATLLERFGIEGIRGILADKAKMAKALVEVEQELAGMRHQVFYLNAAEALGYQMATGHAGTEHTLLNAHAIARLMGTGHEAEVRSEDITKVEPIIDALASLYALTETNGDLITEALKVFDAEAARKDGGNGVDLVLRMHQKLQKESKERLFKGQEALMMKGYLPEVYNPYIEVVTVEASKAESMKQQGYGEGMVVGRDDNDPETNDKLLFARHGSGLLPYLTGIFSMTATKTKGSRKHGGNTDLFSTQGQYNSDMMFQIKKNKKNSIEDLFTRRQHPSKSTKTFMVPVINPRGEVVNYRYMMRNETKDTVLLRDNRFDKLLGAMAGSIFDKQASPNQNKVTVEALKAQYDLEFKRRAASYIEIGPRSPDPEMREIYRLMPEATKQAIREVWKADSMYVRIDLLDINFGYRKKSLSDVFKDDKDAREGLVKFTAEFLGFFLGGGRLPINATDEEITTRDAKASVRIRTVEEVWQTFVREAKDIIVVKSVSTLFGNVMSNFSLLYAYGVPVTDMLRSHRIALRGAVAYKKDSDELFNLQTKLDTGTSGNVGETKKRIVQLNDALARNPVRQLIEAGLMPTIVEDMEMDDDIYSAKSRFVKRMEGVTSKINPHVLNVGKGLYMTHDTKLYKALSQGAQLSDFLARYTLYQHMTTKKRDPMGSEEAIQLASDAFINYDVPTHRNMQYLNDMGFLRFTKYYLRIQKVILHLYRDNPGRMLGLMMMGNYFDSLPTVLDSAMINRFGNPLEAGALVYPASLDDLATMKVLYAPFK